MRYKLKTGKFGMYFYDSESNTDLELIEVVDLLNKNNNVIRDIESVLNKTKSKYIEINTKEDLFRVLESGIMITNEAMSDNSNEVLRYLKLVSPDNVFFFDSDGQYGEWYYYYDIDDQFLSENKWFEYKGEDYEN